MAFTLTHYIVGVQNHSPTERVKYVFNMRNDISFRQAYVRGTFATDASAEQTAEEPEQPMITPTMADLMIWLCIEAPTSRFKPVSRCPGHDQSAKRGQLDDIKR